MLEKNKEWPLVTISTLVYNSGHFVIEALEIVKNQSYPNIQHIIIDDFSTDQSVDRVEDWITKNNYSCLFIKHESNKGIQNSLKEVFQAAKGKYICFVSDDLWTDNEKLNKQATFLEANPDYGLVHTNFKIYHQETGIYEELDFVRNEGHIFRNLLDGNTIGAMTVMIRRNLINSALKDGIFDQGFLMEDYPLWLYVSLKAKIGYMNEITSVWRKRDESASNSKNKIKNILFENSILQIQTFFAEPSPYFSELKGRLVYLHQVSLRTAFTNSLPAISENSFSFLKRNHALTFNDRKYYYGTKHPWVAKGFRKLRSIFP